MEYRLLGRTGLKVSVMGLGAGGPSRLGRRDDMNSEEEAAAILRQGLDAGINFIDTAEAYGTETVVGKAIAGRDRASLVISTKKSTHSNLTPESVTPALEASLERMGTDYVDVYHLHGVPESRYDHCLEKIVPVLQDLQQQGLIRHIGITEAFNSDLAHTMLQRALADGVWDVMMVGFNLLNQSARETVLRPAIEQNIGILIMFAVRRVLSQPDRLRETIQTLIDSGDLDPAELNAETALDFLLADSIATSVPDASYRFCRDEPGVHVVLSGTGNPAHMQANITSLERPPLPPDVISRLKHIFRKVHSITGE